MFLLRLPLSAGGLFKRPGEKMVNKPSDTIVSVISEGFQTCTSTYYRAEVKRESFMLVIRSLLNDLGLFGGESV